MTIDCPNTHQHTVTIKCEKSESDTSSHSYLHHFSPNSPNTRSVFLCSAGVSQRHRILSILPDASSSQSTQIQSERLPERAGWIHAHKGKHTGKRGNNKEHSSATSEGSVHHQGAVSSAPSQNMALLEINKKRIMYTWMVFLLKRCRDNFLINYDNNTRNGLTFTMYFDRLHTQKKQQSGSWDTEKINSNMKLQILFCCRCYIDFITVLGLDSGLWCYSETEAAWTDEMNFWCCQFCLLWNRLVGQMYM